MNRNALGAISELLCAVAVVITLAYLAVEVRQNTRTMRSTTFQAINDGMSRVTEVFATDAELSRMMLKAMPGLAHLTPEERVRYSFALLMVMRRLHAVLTQEKFGMVSTEFAMAYVHSAISVFAASAGAREWRGSAKLAFPQAFVKRIDDLIASGSLHAPRHVGMADEDPSTQDRGQTAV